MVRVITQPDFFTGEHDLIHALFESGLMELLVRKPDAKKSDLKDWISKIDSQYYNRLVLYEGLLSGEIDFRGIHHNSLSKIINGCRYYSRSCHSIEEVIHYADKYDLLVLSPVFSSISKSNYAPKKQWDLSELGDEIKDKLMALGGISENKLRQLPDLGFRHIALLGAIWQSSNPIESFKRIKEKWEKLDQSY